MTTSLKTILCIGSVLWDIVGRSDRAMNQGSDVPGRIKIIPGGVAMNIAMALRGVGQPVALLSAIGRDKAGDDLITAAEERGMDASFIYRSDDLPTDQYMAIEGINGLIAAIADAHSLEAAGEKILRPLKDGRLAGPDAPWNGMTVLDGNLTAALLREISKGDMLAHADLRIAPASPGKAERLRTFLGNGKATLYVNLEEASILCHQTFDTTAQAAQAMLNKGAFRAVVTDGGNAASVGDAQGIISALPPKVLVARVTGAGDVFMASHIAAELNDITGMDALTQALSNTAAYISTETPL